MYEIYWNGLPVGHAEVKTEGMFYRFYCACRMEEGSYRIAVTDGTREIDLGICVPDGGDFVCAARVSRKRFNNDKFLFTVIAHKGMTGIPVVAGEPFLCLDGLNTARLCLANGQPEIIITPIQDPQDSGPNPTHPHKWESQ